MKRNGYYEYDEKYEKLRELCKKFCVEGNPAYSTTSIVNSLHRGGIDSIDDLKNAREEDILKMRTIGVAKLELIMHIKRSIT